jgi:hypothetical protein
LITHAGNTLVACLTLSAEVRCELPTVACPLWSSLIGVGVAGISPALQPASRITTPAPRAVKNAVSHLGIDSSDPSKR